MIDGILETRGGEQDMEKVEAQVGDAIRGYHWPAFECATLRESDGFRDSSFAGCMFRVTLDNVAAQDVAVNVKVTGRPRLIQGSWASRCKIEFVGDGEPSTFTGGTLYHNKSIGWRR